MQTNTPHYRVHGNNANPTNNESNAVSQSPLTNSNLTDRTQQNLTNGNIDEKIKTSVYSSQTNNLTNGQYPHFNQHSRIPPPLNDPVSNGLNNNKLRSNNSGSNITPAATSTPSNNNNTQRYSNQQYHPNQSNPLTGFSPTKSVNGQICEWPMSAGQSGSPFKQLIPPDDKSGGSPYKHIPTVDPSGSPYKQHIPPVDQSGSPYKQHIPPVNQSDSPFKQLVQTTDQSVPLQRHRSPLPDPPTNRHKSPSHDLRSSAPPEPRVLPPPPTHNSTAITAPYNGPPKIDRARKPVRTRFVSPTKTVADNNYLNANHHQFPAETTVNQVFSLCQFDE